jgi:ABC-type polysaccharide/polyol phosphate export permease
MSQDVAENVASAGPFSPERSRPPASSSGPPPELVFRRPIHPWAALRELVEYRVLALTLAERDLRARYKQAFLGWAWAILTPLMLMFVFTLVFTKFARVDSGGVPYPLFAYVGLVPWTFFNNAVNGGGMSLINNMPLLNKMYCPREVFPLAAMAVAAVDAVLSVFVLIVIFIFEGYAPHVQALWAPLLLLVELVYAIAVSLAVSALLVYLRDLRHALPLLLQVALYATPVAYGLSAIAKSRTFLLVYSGLNPLAPVIDGLRRTVLHGQLPDWTALGIAAASSSLLLGLAYLLFKRLETGMADIA